MTDDIIRRLREILNGQNPSQWMVCDPKDITALIDGLERMQVQERRIRWIASHCRRTEEHLGGRWSIVIEGPSPSTNDNEDDFYAAIDAAREAEK